MQKWVLVVLFSKETYFFMHVSLYDIDLKTEYDTLFLAEKKQCFNQKTINIPLFNLFKIFISG